MDINSKLIYGVGITQMLQGNYGVNVIIAIMPPLQFSEQDYKQIGFYMLRSLLEFAEGKIQIKNARSLLDIKDILETQYTDGITSIPKAYIDEDTITGIFEDQVSPNLIKKFNFTVTEAEISYSLVNPDAINNFTEFDFAATSTRAKKSCPKGTPCGGTCISKLKTCRKDNPAGDKVKQIKEQVKKGNNKPKEKLADQTQVKSNPKTKENKPAPSDKTPSYVQQDKLDAKRKSLVEFLGKDGEELVSRAEQNIQKLLDNADVFVRVPNNEILKKIIEGGRFKSQFETGKSKGLLSQKTRSEAEQEMFGYENKLDPTKRPIYGYLGDPKDRSQDGPDTGYYYGNFLDKYGQIAVKLKPSAKDRATVTGNDSLNGKSADNNKEVFQPSAVNKVNLASLLNPSWVSGAKSDIEDGAEEIETYRDAIKHFASLKNMGEVREAFGAYVEAQIHSQLPSSEIAEIVYIKPAKRNKKAPKPDQAVIDWAKQQGVKITNYDD